MKSFEGSSCNLNVLPSTSILLNFSFPFIDIRWFFCQVLQYSRTIVLLKKKRRWSCDFPPRKTPVAQKHCAISRQEKMAFSTPPPSHRVCTDRRMDVRTYVRTDGHMTITSQPKFLGSIGYQICLAMELRWRALPAGSAMRNKSREC